MAAINYRLRSQADKNVSIYIHLTLGRGKVFETPTGFYINPKYWKKGNKYGFPKNLNLAEIKNIKSALLKLSSFIDKAINLANENSEFIDTNWLKKQIDVCFDRIKEEVKSNLLVDYIQKIIDNADTKVLQGGKIGLSKNRVKGYVTFKGIIEKYQKHIKKEIDFKDIDINFEEDFKYWLLKKQDYGVNYAGKNFDNLKAVCNDAMRKGREVNDHARHIQSFSENKDDRDVITLSFDELDVISNVPNLSESLENVRKWLLLGCEIGQRGGDLLSITEGDFRTDDKGIEFIDIKQEKTGKNVTIPVRPKVKEIKESGLPYKISIQRFNDYLKDLCQIAELNYPTKGKLYDKVKKRKIKGIYEKYKLITSHSCRKSFATNYYKKIPTPILRIITAHSKESLFLSYIGKEEDKDANAKMMLKYAEIMDIEVREQKENEKQNRKAKMKVVKEAN